MRLLVGTSGYSYKEWKGSFYPEDLAAAKMLGYYASRLTTVEINNTFYRMPSNKTLAQWSEQVPDGFVFVIKAPRRITHQHRLKDADDSVAYLLDVTKELGDKLGPILFQLPPFLRKDVPRLRDFLALLPDGHRFTIEFRHQSWFDDEVFETLRSKNVALCVADGEKVDPGQHLSTADWGYVRLRKEAYDRAELENWCQKIGDNPWQEAFVFFKHEEKGPALAAALKETFDR